MDDHHLTPEGLPPPALSLRPLLDFVATGEFEDFGYMTLESAVWADNDVTLHLLTHMEDEKDQSWRIRCHCVRGSVIRGTKHHDLHVETEHPLLLPYVRPTTELYFRGLVVNPDEIVGALVEAHRGLVGSWFDWPHFMNDGRPLRELLAGGHGKLAEGPLPLMEEYARVLTGHGIEVSSPPSQPPYRWDGDAWVAERGDVFALILGDSYVITPNLTAERDDSPR